VGVKTAQATGLGSLTAVSEEVQQHNPRFSRFCVVERRQEESTSWSMADEAGELFRTGVYVVEVWMGKKEGSQEVCI
jgi:hypothetical protein